MLYSLNRFLLAVIYVVLLHMILVVVLEDVSDESEDEYKETKVSNIVREGDIAVVKNKSWLSVMLSAVEQQSLFYI